MKVFISWSGELSEVLAGKLRDWLPNVIQRVQPYFTPKDIDKGARWVSEISNELSQSRLGVICVTPDNMESSWIMFEAGAISATFSQQSKICPILFGLDKKDLRGPLFQFQGISFSEIEIKALIETINAELGDERLAQGTLDKVFEKWWPELRQTIESTMLDWKPQRPPEKSHDERHLEVMSAIHQIAEMRREELRLPLTEDIFVNLYANVDAAFGSQDDPVGLLEALSMIVRNLEFVHNRVYEKPKHLERASRVLERILAEQKKRESRGAKPLAFSDEIKF